VRKWLPANDQEDNELSKSQAVEISYGHFPYVHEDMDSWHITERVDQLIEARLKGIKGGASIERAAAEGASEQAQRAFANLRSICGEDFFNALCSEKIKMSGAEAISLAGKEKAEIKRAQPFWYCGIKALGSPGRQCEAR
jgi:hypothetical protein